MRLTRLLLRAVLFLAVALISLIALPATSFAQTCDPAVNEIVCENAKPGAPEWSWRIQGYGDPTIQGFATSMSVAKGQRISFKIKSETPDYSIDILRLGSYGGDGARLIQGGIRPTGPSSQPACLTQETTGLVDCGNWAVSAGWDVPADAVSGVYIAHLVRDDGGEGSHIVFVIRDDGGHSDIVVQTSDATWQAYNAYGGSSTYNCGERCPPGEPLSYKGAFKVSYNRPLQTEADGQSPRSSLFGGAEYSMIRFLEANGYDVSYLSQVDVESRGHLLRNHKLYISSGHDEYTSANQRTNIEAARDAGVNLAFFSGNEMFWKTRYEPSIDGSETADRTLVTYKDTHFNGQRDPVTWTGTWLDSRFTNPADGIKPSNALTGQTFVVNSGTSDIMVPAAYGQLRMWRNTAAETLATGTNLRLGRSTLGYEWDVDTDNGFRPAGQFRLSSTTASGLEIFTDFGSSTAFNQTATHNLVMYRAASGALVFGAGTVQWAWGLDRWNGTGLAPDRNMQQATVNLFADMGVQPDNLSAALVPAEPSTDAIAPTAAITAPPASVADGTRITLSGTAQDVGGGVVAGVEVSTDGGATWHPATGTTAWTYSWVAHGHPTAAIKVRAVDDSGNLGAPGPAADIAITCPCSLLGRGLTPAGTAASGDPNPVEVGLKFRSDSYGTVSGVRFYKLAANTGTHRGSLWTGSGQRLAQATFENETATGWQTVTFDSPVEVMPNTTYVASYHAPNGNYALTLGYFYPPPSPAPGGGAMHDSPPLHALRDFGTVRNGVFSYGTASTFPTSSFQASNYWVDPMFTPAAIPGAVTGVTATEGGRTSANLTWQAPADGGRVTSYVVTPYIGGQALEPKIVTGSPPETSLTITGLTSGTTYRFTVQARNPNGSGPASPLTGPVTPRDPVAPPAPTAVSGQPAGGSVQVRWTLPASDGDSPLTGQTVTPFDGTQALPTVNVGPSATSALVTGLTNGTSYTFKVSATNAVGTGAVSVASAPVIPQATLYDFDVPERVDSEDPLPVELGVKFRPAADGTITGVRFYKSAANNGPHVGSLWTIDGQRLAQATFTGESATGWQSVRFATPVPVVGGTTYVASYFAPEGRYAFTTNGLANGRKNGLLRAPADSADSRNGVYAYAGASTFPTSSYQAASYSVDVLYAVPKPGQPAAPTATSAGRTSAEVTWQPPATGGPVTSYVVTPFIGTVAQPSTTLVGEPPATTTTITGLTSGTSYRFRVQARNANGAGTISELSNAVTPGAAVAPSAPTDVKVDAATRSAQVRWTRSARDGDSPITGQTVIPYAGGQPLAPVQVGATASSALVQGLEDGVEHTFRVTATNAVGTSADSAPSAPVTPRATIFDFQVPETIDSNDGSAVELGVKFRTDFEGWVTGIRFYKGAGNSGVHTGSLWTATGDRLAQATFTNETASGWQTVEFAERVRVVPGTTYIASYHSPNGHYSLTRFGLRNGTTNGVLRALADDVSPNGVFAYGSTSRLPEDSYQGSNYLVDVIYVPEGRPGAVTGVQATAGRRSAAVTWTAPADGGPVQGYEITAYSGGTAQATKTVTGTPPATEGAIGGLQPGTAYTITVRAKNPSGSGAESDPSAPVTPVAAVAPGAPTAVSAAPELNAAVVRWTAPADDGGSDITGYVITPHVGGSAGDAIEVAPDERSRRLTGLTGGVAHTFTVVARSAAGNGEASAPSAPVTPTGTLFGLSTPANVDAGDTSSVVLGVKFRSDIAGTIKGIRFYKAPDNTGTHAGSLWAANGALLAEATFADETPSGWQTVEFATPVPIEADTTYVASYLAPRGHYSLTGAAFSGGGIGIPPLHALSDVSSPNGVYAYSAGSVFPSNSWNASNYWVDVLFTGTG